MSAQLVRILQANPLANYQASAAEIDAAIRRVAQSGIYLSGTETKSFETEFAEFMGAAHAIGASNGTDALWLALRACAIGRGDEVITVSHTAVATVAAIVLSGATPVLVEIDPRTLTLDPRALEGARSERTRAVVAVHLYGQPADLDAIAAFCERHSLRLIEDCAQAAGAWHGERRVGTIGDAGAFSFYPTKNLAALGDGGMVLTKSAQIAAEARALREYGWRDARRVSEVSGRNARLDEIQAAILRVKLRRLDQDNNARRELAAAYSRGLADLREITLPTAFAFGRSVFHQYVIRSERRDALAENLRAAGIATAVHYPRPVHAQPAYRAAAAGPLPATMRAAQEVLSLPMFPELKLSAAREVAGAIREFFTR